VGADAKSWKASLHLSFTKEKDRTALARQSHQGPLLVQRPFYPEGHEVCHVYLLHPPGGLVPGDSLQVNVSAAEGTHVLVTAPAATKIYRSDGRGSSLVQTLQVAAGAVLEWLPQETIVFEGARAEVVTKVDLQGDASFFGWEIVCLGRPACDERFRTGICQQQWELRRDGQPLVFERARFDDEVQKAAWGTRGAPVVGTLLASWPGVIDVDYGSLFGAALSPVVGDWLATTRVRGALLMRYMGSSAERARGFFERAWTILRPLVAKRPACFPRIWST
jgi:urease accessory protein